MDWGNCPSSLSRHYGWNAWLLRQRGILYGELDWVRNHKQGLVRFADITSFGCFWASGTSFGWRFPNAVIVLWALLLLAGTFFIPESPRWLASKGREDEALQILSRLHHDPNDSQNTFAEQELVTIREQILEDQKQQKLGGRWQMFKEKTYRKRLILSCMVAVGSQNTGILVGFFAGLVKFAS